MAVVEVRFRVRETGEFKKALNENKKESQALIDQIKNASKQVGGGLVLSLRDARKIINDLGGDTKRFEAAMRAAGIPLRDAKLLTQQLNKELNASRKEVLGIEQGTGRLTRAIREGTFAAEAMHRVFDKAKQAVDAMARLGKVKGLEESTADAMELQKQFDKLQGKLSLMKDPKQFAQVRKAIEDTSVLHNIPQTTLIDAVMQAQETKSAGRELTLDKGGALLKQVAQAAYGDFMEPGEVAAYLNSQVVLMKDLGLTDAKQLHEVQGITRAGEEAGALSARSIATKGGKIIAQLKGLRGTTGIEAYREGQGLLQTIGDAPGISGDTEVAVNRAENLIAKLMDKKTQERIKKTTGVDVVDKKGNLRKLTTVFAELAVSQKGGKFKIPESDADLAEAERDPKKASLYKDWFEWFHDMQAREGALAVFKGRDKLKKLENVDPSVGHKILQEGYEGRMQSFEGQLTQRQMRDELTHAQGLAEKFPWIRAAAEVKGQFEAKHPGLASAAGVAGDVAGIAGPKAKAAVEVGLATLAAGATGVNIEHPREKMLAEQHSAAMAESKQRTEEARQRLAALEKQLADAQAKAREQGIDLRVQVNVQEGQSATVTTEARKTAQAARSGARKPVKSGQH